MILRYRVSLPNIKGFARIYEVKGSSTLYSFHKQMRADMDFPQDQLVLFKALDKAGNVSSKYGIFDLGAGTIDSVKIEDTYRKGEISFIYFYDTTNAKSVIITCEGETDFLPGTVYPILVESKGPNPIEFENGYVAFEDLPDDKKKSELDDSDDEEDQDDEPDDEIEEIFSEDEDDE